MAMNVQFLKGQSSKFSTITKVETTFYYLEDTKELYLGSKLLSNEISAEQFATLEGRVKALEDWKLVLTELSKDNGANDLVKVTVTTEAGAVKSVVVDDAALDQKLADDLAEAKKYTDDAVEGIVSGSGYATQTWVNTQISTHEEAQAQRDAAQTEALQAEIDADVKVVTDYIAENESKWLEKYDDTALAGRVTAVEAVADAAQTAQEVSDAIDAKISTYNTELDLANKLNKVDSDAQGYASTAETNAKGYADQKLLDFENAYIKADENGTIDKLNEIAAWISDDEAGATKIISDVATNAANIKTINESAVMTSGITAAKVGEYDTTKNTVDTNKSTWDSVVNKLDASTYNTFVGTTYATLDAAVAAANSHADSKDTDIAKGVDAQTRVATLEGKVTTWDGKQDALTDVQLAAVNSGITEEKVADMASLKGENHFSGINYFADITIDASMAGGTGDSGFSFVKNGGGIILGTDGEGEPDMYIKFSGPNTTKFYADRIERDGHSGNGDDKPGVLYFPSNSSGTLATVEYVAGNFVDPASAESIANDAALAVRGATTNTVKDCVDAINAMNNQTGEVIGTVENIVNQLTWGEF